MGQDDRGKRRGRVPTETTVPMGTGMSWDELLALAVRLDAKVRSLGEVNRCLSAENERLLKSLLKAERRIADLTEKHKNDR